MNRILKGLVLLLQLGQSLAVPIELIYQFPNTSFVALENIAVRSNGHLLLNAVSQPTTFALDPTKSGSVPQVVYNYPGATSVLGIAEYAPDEFAVAVGNYSIATRTPVPGSFSVWSLNVRSAAGPTARKITAIPEAVAFNGMTAISTLPGVVFVADSVLGLVWYVNTTTGAYHRGVQDPLMAPKTSSGLGINGVHASPSGSKLYFTNSNLDLFASIALSSSGNAVGSATVIANAVANNTYDDFALDALGNAYIATHPDSIYEVTSTGGQVLVAGGNNLAQLDQPTSAAFGRSSASQQCTLYVVGAGTASSTSVMSGQVNAIKLC